MDRRQGSARRRFSATVTRRRGLLAGPARRAGLGDRGAELRGGGGAEDQGALRMAFRDDIYTQRQLERWTRPDAHHFVRADWRRSASSTSNLAAVFGLYERKYREDQLRDHGRFAYEGRDKPRRVQLASSESGSLGPKSKLAVTVDGNASFGATIDAAKQLYAAGNNSYQRCLNLCYPILERFSRPGSDINTFDFHKCMNACLGK